MVVCQVPDLEHDGFYEPVCIIVPDCEYNSDETLERVKLFFESKYKEYERPKEIIFKESLPLTKVGKPDVISLEKELLNQFKGKSKKLTRG